MKTRFLALVALFLLTAGVPAAGPRDEVLRLVPGDVGFCLLVQDLRSHAAAFAESPFLAQLRNSPLGASLRNAPEVKVLTQVKESVESHLGMSLAQLRDDILGDAVVFAYRPGPVDHPDREQGLIALHARDADLLGRLIERLNAVQEKAGELKAVEPASHRRVAYQRRVLAQGANYLLQRGPLLVLATDEALMREVIDRHLAASGEEAEVVRQFRLLGLENRLAALWINPRPFEPALRRRAAEVGGLRAAALQTLLSYWQALDGVALSLSVGKELEVILTLRGDAERLPPAGRRFLATASRASDLWQCFPPDAILTVAGRFDVHAFAEMLGEFLPDQARSVVRAAVEQSLGVLLNKEALTRILPHVGPDWGFCVFPPRPEDKGCIPPLVFAVRVRPDGATGQELLGAVVRWAELLAKAYNQLHASAMGLRSLYQDKVEVKYLTDETAFPAGFRPAFALKGGYLLLASSPEAMQRFTAAANQPAPPEAADVPLVRFAPRALAGFLMDRRPTLVPYLALAHRLPPEEVRQRLQDLIEALELFDGVEIRRRASPHQLALVLRVRTAQPLR